MPGKILEIRQRLAGAWRASGSRDVLLLDIALDNYFRWEGCVWGGCSVWGAGVWRCGRRGGVVRKGWGGDTVCVCVVRKGGCHGVCV